MQRFISEDPIGFCGGDVNLYSYAGNNPVNLTDPLGLEISFDAQGNVIGEEEGLQTPLLSPGDVVGLAGLGIRACGRIALGAGRILGNEIGAIGARRLQFGNKLDFLFNRNINPSVPKNVARARGNADRIGIADTPENRAEVTRRFNEAFNDPTSIVGPGNLSGSNRRELFLPGVTGTGSKIQFVEQGGKVITIIAK